MGPLLWRSVGPSVNNDFHKFVSVVSSGSIKCFKCVLGCSGCFKLCKLLLAVKAAKYVCLSGSESVGLQ